MASMMYKILPALVTSCKSCIATRAAHHSNYVLSVVQARGYCDEYNRTNPDVAAGAIHNVQSIRSKWVEHFTYKNIPEPEVSAELIVAHVLGWKTVRFA